LAKHFDLMVLETYIEVVDIKTPPVLTFACWFKEMGKGNGRMPQIYSSDDQLKNVVHS